MSTPEKKKLEIHVNAQTPFVLVIGNIMEAYSRDYIYALRELGYEFLHIGTGSKFINTHYYPFEKVIRAPGRIAEPYRELSIEALLDFLKGFEFSFILHLQDEIHFKDRQKCSIPYLYLAKNVPYNAKYPRAAWRFFVESLNLYGILKGNPNLYATIQYHPPAISVPLNFAPSTMERTIEAGYLGDPYLTRNKLNVLEFIQKLIQNVPSIECHYLGVPPQDPMENTLREIGAGQGALSPSARKFFWSKCKVGFSMASMGSIVMDDLEICLNGAMLVTQKTLDHDAMGFEDGVNCRMYETMEQAISAMRDYDPKIAAAGQKLVLERHTIRKRVENLANQIETEMGIMRPIPIHEKMRPQPFVNAKKE
jgi:hypothetical protein